MISFVRLLLSFIALATCSEVLKGQSVDETDEIAFFEIDKMCIPSHRSNIRKLAHVRQHF